MKETSSEPPNIDPIRSGPISKAHGFFRRSSKRSDGNILPVSNPPANYNNSTTTTTPNTTSNGASTFYANTDATKSEKPAQLRGDGLPSPNPGRTSPPSAQNEAQGTVVDPEDEKKVKPNMFANFYKIFKMILFHSWINVLLVFVPVGIAVKQIHGLHAGVVFAMNAIAIVPLAGLLSHATESVASKLGDTIGALLNVTFGNAVELIIFMYVTILDVIKTRKRREVPSDIIVPIESQIIETLQFIALTKGQIRIVQASLLGSILANLLLILGMSFFLGGLRFREQIYNSTVTQMSACLLSLSVISLVLPTAFHASFKNTETADEESMKVSRGTSVILLLVYLVYLLFQLKSHAYMYQSTPQHIVDAESTPGPAAGWLDSSSSDSSSSSSSDSDDSSRSRDTMRKKMKKVLRGGRRRKSSVASLDANDTLPKTRTPSFGTMDTGLPDPEHGSEGSSSRPKIPRLNSVGGSEEAVEEEKPRKHRRKWHGRHKRSKKQRHRSDDGGDLQPTISERPENVNDENEPRRVDFALQSAAVGEDGLIELGPTASGRRPFPTLRGISVKNLAPTVFTHNSNLPGVPPAPVGHVPRVRYGIRRTNSLPDRLNDQQQFRAHGAMLPSQIPLMALTGGTGAEAEQDLPEDHLSRTSAIVLLLVSTALVAVCAEFLVDSIHEVVETSSIGEIFIGLILLPIVGNAAEHVTAITVAMKNKMDLAIGVAVGSSIQIALFITPLIVILGWIINQPMTLYFTLFETVCLFVSTFIVNFLVLDGRSNYLEGALLCSTYIIIAVAAFFYPNEDDAN